MVSLVDIVPQTRKVQIAAGEIELRGLGLRHIADLFLRFPELRKVFVPGSPEVDIAILIVEMPEAIAAIIAEAAGQPDAADKIADAMAPDDAAACLLAVQELTMPAPFFSRLSALLGNDAGPAAPSGREADTSMPPPPNSSSHPGTARAT